MHILVPFLSRNLLLQNGKNLGLKKKIVLANELSSVLPKIEKWKGYQAFHMGELVEKNALEDEILTAKFESGW